VNWLLAKHFPFAGKFLPSLVWTSVTIFVALVPCPLFASGAAPPEIRGYWYSIKNGGAAPITIIFGPQQSVFYIRPQDQTQLSYYIGDVAILPTRKLSFSHRFKEAQWTYSCDISAQANAQILVCNIFTGEAQQKRIFQKVRPRE
jgi:hypothetical protein